MKKIFKIFLVLLILLAISSLLIGSQLMAADEKTVLKFAHVLELDHPYHKMALKFKEELESRTRCMECVRCDSHSNTLGRCLS